MRIIILDSAIIHSSEVIAVIVTSPTHTQICVDRHKLVTIPAHSDLSSHCASLVV